MSLKTFLNAYPLISILLLVWSMGLVSFATIKVFTDMTTVGAAVASCYAALLGIPPAAIALYKWRNS